MENYQNAGQGLKQMFIAALGAVICTVLAIIPLINILAGIGALVFLIISLVGLNNAGKDIAGCKTAFTITIVNLIVSILGGVLSFGSATISSVITIVGYVLSLVSTYYVCTSVAKVMEQVGAGEVAQKGYTVWKINLVCYIVMIVVAVLAMIPALAAVAVVMSIVVAIIALIAEILYMIFLNQSYKALGA